VADTNSVIAGLLRDLAFAQTSPQRQLGYKRAAATILGLDVPIESLVNPDGTLQRIANIGPASTRIILEVLSGGASETVEGAVEASGRRSDILRRRGLRTNFLSRAEANRALALDRPEAPALDDYRADLQMHSDWSDGSQTLSDIVATGIARGCTHAAVTDHSYGLPIARGLSMEQIASQHHEIDALNRQFHGRFRLLKGIEANIRGDGSLDMTGDELTCLEIVVAAPHASLRLTADQTDRLVTVVNTPGVHILGHPRGRIYGSRPGLIADWDRVFTAAAGSGVAIEIDGDPSRQDLDHELAARALDSGCLFALDSDAHATDQWWYAELAIAHARLAGVPKERVVNCWPLAELMAWAHLRSNGERAADDAARWLAAR
jgi:histidinol phosphatase-like PHP family hydrolase